MLIWQSTLPSVDVDMVQYLVVWVTSIWYGFSHFVYRYLYGLVELPRWEEDFSKLHGLPCAIWWYSLEPLHQTFVYIWVVTWYICELVSYYQRVALDYAMPFWLLHLYDVCKACLLYLHYDCLGRVTKSTNTVGWAWGYHMVECCDMSLLGIDV